MAEGERLEVRPLVPIWVQTRMKYLRCQGGEAPLERPCTVRPTWRQQAQRGYMYGYVAGPMYLCTMHKKGGEVPHDFNI